MGSFQEHMRKTDGEDVLRRSSEIIEYTRSIYLALSQQEHEPSHPGLDEIQRRVWFWGQGRYSITHLTVITAGMKSKGPGLSWRIWDSRAQYLIMWGQGKAFFRVNVSEEVGKLKGSHRVRVRAGVHRLTLIGKEIPFQLLPQAEASYLTTESWDRFFSQLQIFVFVWL